jgi:hypothetical protein
MVNLNKIAIIGLFDNSGSMRQFDTSEFIVSINNIIKEQSNNSEVVFYGATFSNKFNLFMDGVNGNDVDISIEDFKPYGPTALIPSFARMIRIVGSRLNDMREEDRPGKIIFILLSDGKQTTGHLKNRCSDDAPYENNKGFQNLKYLIEEHENIWKWEFMFMGTNFDSISTGKKLGLTKSKCINFATSDNGIQNVMKCVSKNISKIKQNDLSGFDDIDRINSMSGK